MAGVSASVGLSRRALLALAAGGVAPRGGRAAALSPVRIAAATAIPHAYNGYMIAGAATGLYARVGLQPEFLWIAGSAAALQLILSGDADIANVSFLDFIAAKQKQPRLPARMVYCQDYTSSYVLVVPEASPIRSLADFKGKSVGVVSLASGTVRSAQATLRQAGYDPADTEIVAVGPDAAALAALRSGRVDALDAFIGGDHGECRYAVSPVHRAVPGRRVRGERTDAGEESRFAGAGISGDHVEHGAVADRSARGVAGVLCAVRRAERGFRSRVGQGCPYHRADHGIFQEGG
jgi:hypothetical protein